jgi:hypothetical protein
MNPAISTSYAEAGRWLENFAASHAKREHPAVVAHVAMADGREGRSYGLWLSFAGVAFPPAGSPPLELEYADVTEGRTRFQWCEALADRLRGAARRLLEEAREAQPA